MARNSSYLLNLDVDKLFEDHRINEILELEKMLDLEIERKRVDLRSMVGDRYKDVLTASDAIKSMKTISENIVDNIQFITDHCEKLFTPDTATVTARPSVKIEQKTVEERTLVMQINLSLTLNEQIWSALDEEDNLKATQFFLLAQHIQTGLSLTRKEILERTPITKQIKTNLSTLKDIILMKIKTKLESVEINAEETSNNLNALMLIKNHDSQELIRIFISHRKIALNTVINSSHSSVRLQIKAMVKCLITTIHVLHDCFLGSDNLKTGLIWQYLEKITNENAPAVLSKVKLPLTHLTDYIPDIIKQYRPKLKSQNRSQDTTDVLEDWLKSTSEIIDNGVKNSLELITNVKGLHIMREEALKMEPPDNWDKICSKLNLPENFNVWYYFFQKLITNRARYLISLRLSKNLQEIEELIDSSIKSGLKSHISESDLRQYTWTEEESDISRNDNSHVGLTMKTKGYSPNVLDLCQKIDNKYLGILSDVSLYLFGEDFKDLDNKKVIVQDYKFKRKFVDKEELENHLTLECSSKSTQISTFVCDYVKRDSIMDTFLVKSIICARFLQAVTILCPHFTKCCSFNGKTEYWNKVGDEYLKSSIDLWSHWLDSCTEITKEISASCLENIAPTDMIKILARWNAIEIQEQTDTTTFMSYIKVPLKPSLPLNSILESLNEKLSCVLTHTLPKQIHLQFIERNLQIILTEYKILSEKEVNQNQALQFLFDVKFVTTFCIPRDNTALVAESQNICDKFRSKIDPFDLDVFYPYLQNNVKKAVVQAQVILGCLLPSPSQLNSLATEKAKEPDKEPSILALSAPSTNSWFPLLPITVPSQKSITSVSAAKENKGAIPKKITKPQSKKSPDTSVMKSSAAALFGGFTSEWFS